MKRAYLIFVVAFLFESCGKKNEESASTEPKSAKTIFTTDNGAIGGYDVVAFFLEKMPVIGDKNFSTEWNGATWYFSSEKNRELFKADPVKYAPQYGGYCAYGTAEGHKAPTQPDTWTLVDGKLYFNYNKDVQKAWLENQRELIQKADRNWPEVKRLED